jgi:hypothetical protein
LGSSIKLSPHPGTVSRSRYPLGINELAKKGKRAGSVKCTLMIPPALP